MSVMVGSMLRCAFASVRAISSLSGMRRSIANAVAVVQVRAGPPHGWPSPAGPTRVEAGTPGGRRSVRTPACYPNIGSKYGMRLRTVGDATVTSVDVDGGVVAGYLPPTEELVFTNVTLLFVV